MGAVFSRTSFREASDTLALCLYEGQGPRVLSGAVAAGTSIVHRNARTNPSTVPNQLLAPRPTPFPRVTCSLPLLSSGPVPWHVYNPMRAWQLKKSYHVGWTLGTPCNQSSLIHTSPTPRQRQDGTSNDLPGKLEEGKEKALTTVEKALRFIGRLGSDYHRKDVLTLSGIKLYESCVYRMDYSSIFNACSLPDTFQSWFLVAHLHVWFCMVRLKSEAEDGEYLTKQMATGFWHDVELRMKMLDDDSSVKKKSQRQVMHEFYGLTLAYDEGLLLDDRTLAAAVWRNLIHDKEATDPTQLAMVVDYIRRQVQHMDQLDSENLLKTGHIELLPFASESQHSIQN